MRTYVRLGEYARVRSFSRVTIGLSEIIVTRHDGIHGFLKNRTFLHASMPIVRFARVAPGAALFCRASMGVSCARDQARDEIVL